MVSGALSVEDVLLSLPPSLKNDLLDEYRKILLNYHRQNWEGVLVNGGRFCENVYAILNHLPDGNYPDHAEKPSNFVDESLKLRSNSQLPSSCRVIMPYALVMTYSMRNHRDAGHTTKGVIASNESDALMVLRLCKWILSELIRVMDATSSDIAKNIASSIDGREVLVVWKNPDNIERVLCDKLSFSQQALLILYSRIGGQASIKDLIAATEYSNPTLFKKNVIKKLHKQRLIDYDKDTNIVTITPKGCHEVEGSGILKQMLY